MKRKVQFAVILTEEGKTVLVINNDGVFRSIYDWQCLFNASNSKVLYCSETDSIDISLSRHFMS